MIPAALSSQLERGIADFLRMSFWSSTPGMEGVIDRLITTPGALLKGPYVSVKLPFAGGGAAEFFPAVPLGFPAHRHQERAFARLSGAAPRSTLIATGTGSGKTESFLLPILEHCRQRIGTPGIKAILIYPMNALATDQAGRIAAAIHRNPALRGGVTAGLYIGESPGERRTTQRVMSADQLITDRKKLQLSPPDILLTNYKMLDYLLIRPTDQRLWQHNDSGTLRYLVVDELHTFDGAQGTDLACLLRRLKARLQVEPGSLCCVGTSATLGGGEAPATLRAYAEDIFGEPFDEGAVITEERLTPADFFAGEEPEIFGPPSLDNPDALDPSRYPTPTAYVAAQQALWFDEPPDAPPGSDAWRLQLGEQLLHDGMLATLVKVLAKGPKTLDEVVGEIARTDRSLRKAPELARLVLLSLLALISEARSPQPEREESRRAREAAGEPPKTRPFLELRLQLWQRELARMVGSVETQPTMRFSDDLSEEEEFTHLPMIHCRDCGAMGWATHQTRDQPDVFRTGLRRFYNAFFSADPQVKFIWPAAAAPATHEWKAAPRFPLWRESLIRVHDYREDNADEVVHVVLSANVESVKGEQKLHRNCPFCSARGSLTLVGFRAATLTSVYIDQLFASTYNDDKKLLTFSDSVQDAAHRAGFFGARTWRFNLRVALQKVIAANEGITLEALPDRFYEHWRGALPGGELGYVSAFLASNMEWLWDYEAMLESGEPPAKELTEKVNRRVAFETFTEFSLQARIGRSLGRTGSAAAYIDPEHLNNAVELLLEPLRNEIGGLRELDGPRLRAFIVGALHHLRERGGLYHRELPDDYIQTGSTYMFRQLHHLPAFGRTSRLPALLTTGSRSPRFDALLHKGGKSWYQRWIGQTMGGLAPLIGAPADIWTLTLAKLTDAGLLIRADTKAGSVWGLRPGSLRVSAETARLRCSACRHWIIVAAAERPLWSTIPCLTARCGGHYVDDEAAVSDYYAELYRNGEVERVFTAEHTGLLTRAEREEVELQFKADPTDRSPWYPNLLSCTPTLEMGIDIGSLSSAILCSVPPTQSNYLQRIGRAGRRDGNSMLLTIALARPHDQYFYAQPEAMISGEVSPPGVFLNASAVLERQLAAYCLDRWNAELADEKSIPRGLKRVFEQLDDSAAGRFPHNWLRFVTERQERLLADFIELFHGRFTEATKLHLRAFLIEGGKSAGGKSEGSLEYKLHRLLRSELGQRDALREQIGKLKAIIDELTKAKARDKEHDERLRDHRRERGALISLVNAINNTPVLQFLTDQGLLPNYAFPESPIRLRSVIWRKKAKRAEGDASNYDTKSFEYTRPAMSALSELAPENDFFAGGRKVAIDQVDVVTAELETWRFCDRCSYSANLATGDLVKDCPQCQSPVWGEESQKRQILRLSQVFANTNDRKSRIGDDQEDRQPKHYNKTTLMSFAEEHRGGAWSIDADATPFGFEYIRRAEFREINFGEHSDSGALFSIGGREQARDGFVICRECGKVQAKKKPHDKEDPKPSHALWCSTHKKGATNRDYEQAIYLYREFSSEALRLLLPLSDLGSETQLNSFLAAFQLGLRDKYGGRVDHLRTMVYDEPGRESEGEGGLRRQYLVLYDTVPGGTGYLKDFTRKPDDGEGYLIFDILKRALLRMKTCVCYPDPDTPHGCYRCLFAYRNSRDMKSTKRSEAIELFDRILSLEAKLRPVDALSTVELSGMMDSVLEARFIAALEHMSTPERLIQVRKAVVHNKPGFRLTIGDVVWNIEPQVELGAKDGIEPSVSIDFVFYLGTNKIKRSPIAVFLDGYQYHRPRIGHDMLQRMTLLSSESYDVWTLSWFDVEQVFRENVDDATFLLHSDASKLRAVAAKQSQLRDFVDAYTKPPMEVFVDSLSAIDDPIPWSGLAMAAILNQLQRPGAVDPALWLEEIAERSPAEVTRWFEDRDSAHLYVRRPPTADLPFGLWACAPRSGFDNLDNYRVFAWLDDSDDERLLTPEFRSLWRGFIHAFQHLRKIRHLWFLSARDQGGRDYRPLALKRDSRSKDDGWSSLEVEPEFEPLRAELDRAGNVPLPEIGIDVPDARDRPSGLIAEFLWADARVAVVESASDAESPVDPEWTLFELASLTESIAPLLAALHHGK